MNRAYLLALMLALLGAAPAPAPLVVGTVRDQHGAPIAGAHVRVLMGERVAGTAFSTADGTFSTPALGDRVRIDCAHCRPLEVPIGPDGVALAIVTRYDAVQNDTPTSDDLAHLPYARIESDISLAPFVVLNQSSRTVSGTSLDDRNALPQSGLLVLNGVPLYDIVAADTPFDTLPYRDATSVSVSRADDGYAYGDLANAGTFSISNGGGQSQAYAGSDIGARANATTDGDDATAAWSDWNAGDRRGRVDLALPFASGTTQGTLSFSSGNGVDDPDGHSALDGAFSSARAAIERDGSVDVFASATVDRASYDYQSARAPLNADWTDVDVTAGVRSNATIAPFALLESRTSTGAYWTLPTDYGSAATILQQTRGVAGVDIRQSAYEAEFTLGTDGARYGGGYENAITSATAPSASGTLDAKLAPGWTLHLGTSRGYVLQTFLGLYGTDGMSPVDATSLSDATVTFDSQARLRASFTTLTSRDAQGNASGGTGASLGWQVAPTLSLRTWLLCTHASAADAQTVGSAWLTYQTTGLRVDAIWRRDLLNRLPDSHLDASIGGALGPHLQWFVASERRLDTRATDAGLRF